MAPTSRSLADLPEQFSLSFWPSSLTLRQKQRAKCFAIESYVSSGKFSKLSNGELEIDGRMHRSQAKSAEPHRMNLKMSSDKIADAYCSCKAGISGECSHTIALIMLLEEWLLKGLKEVPSLPSCTSVTSQWNAPRGAKIASEPVTQMVISNPTTTDRKRKPLRAVFEDNRNVTEGDKERQILHLKSLKDAPVHYLVSSQPVSVDTTYGNVKLGSALIYKAPLIGRTSPISVQPHVSACGVLEYPKKAPITLKHHHQDKAAAWSRLNITQQQAEDIESNTRDQNNCEQWFSERAHRLTSSNFGRVILRKKQSTLPFMKSLFPTSSFTSASTSYGIANEKVAKEAYVRKTGNHLHECGLVINPAFPFLGASPDGKVCDGGVTGILEVKCPHTLRDTTLSAALEDPKLSKAMCVTEDGEGHLHLKPSHMYWYQVQGQLFGTGATFCDFVLFTKKDIHVIRIHPDIPTMDKMLDTLSSFYISQVHPYLQK